MNYHMKRIEIPPTARFPSLSFHKPTSSTRRRRPSAEPLSGTGAERATAKGGLSRASGHNRTAANAGGPVVLGDLGIEGGGGVAV
jgi:hypothetical protein